MVDAQVAVVTNVGFDHLEYAGPTLADVAAEKAAIGQPGSTLVLGETDPGLAAVLPEAWSQSGVRTRGFLRLPGEPAGLGGRVITLADADVDLRRSLSAFEPGATRATTPPSASPPPRPSSTHHCPRTWSRRRSPPSGRAGPVRGARPPAARHRRWGSQPARRRHLRQRALRGLRPRREERSSWSGSTRGGIRGRCWRRCGRTRWTW